MSPGARARRITAQRIACGLAVLVLLGAVILAVGCGRQPQRPNIVLVVLDTVRQDYVGPAGGQIAGLPAGLSPSLQQLATEGTTFTHTWSNSPWTVPSHASLFTGLIPSEHGCPAVHLKLSGPEPTVAELLTAAGYRTGGFFSNPWLSERAAGLMRGFETSVEAPLADFSRGPEHPSWDQGGPQTNANVARWLDQLPAGQPWFLFVNFLEAHLPYDPPPDYRQSHIADISADDAVSVAWGHEYFAGLHPHAQVAWDRVRRLYAGDVNTADRLLASLVAILKQRGQYEDTIIIVTSDHGENLGEHGLLEHQFSVHETVLRVPLVIRAPGRLAPGLREDPVMLTDLFATIMDLAGAKPGRLPRHSRSLLGGEESISAGRPTFAEYAGPAPGLLKLLREFNPQLDTAPLSMAYKTIRVGDWRLSLRADGATQLHDMAADPGQNRNLSEQHPGKVEALMELLAQVATLATGENNQLPELDEKTRSQLRSLGYVH